MGRLIEKIGCKSCGSSKTPALAVYQNGDGREPTGFCYSCRTPFSDPYKGIEMIGKPDVPFPTMPEESIEWIPLASGHNTIPARHINKSTCLYYNVTTIVDESFGEIETHFYPYLKEGVISGYKKRDVRSKGFYSIGDVKETELFGQSTCTTAKKVLIICEGELDAMSAWQMIRKTGKNANVVSLSSGANPNSVKKNYEFVNSYESIILCLDQDEPGHKAAKEIAELFQPGKVKIVELPRKDPNEMLMKGEYDLFTNSIRTAAAHRPDGIKSVEDLLEQALTPPTWGLSWPWPTLTQVTYGIRRGELYGFGAGSGSGKSEAFKEITNHLIQVHNLPVGLVFLEEPAHKTLKVLAGKKSNKRYHVPDGDWTIEEMKEDILSLTDKVFLYDHFGAKNWDVIKNKMRYMVQGLGIKDIFLDHLTALVAQEDNEYKALNRIMEELSTLTEELGCTIYYISHLRKSGGVPHEEGGRVSADQFKGSGAIVFWSHFLFGVERNQQAEDDDEKNTSTFRVLKDRYTGLATGTTFKLYYDHPTGRWQERDEDDFGDML